MRFGQFVFWKWRCGAHDLSFLRGRSGFSAAPQGDSGALGRNGLRFQGFDVSRQADNLLLRELSLECGHERLVASHNFCIGLENGFPDVSLIGSDGGAVGKAYLSVVQSIKGGSTAG